MAEKQIDEATALASFGIRKFNSKKFEGTIFDINPRTPLKSKGIDAAMTAFYKAIPGVFSIEELLPTSEGDSRENS